MRAKCHGGCCWLANEPRTVSIPLQNPRLLALARRGILLRHRLASQASLDSSSVSVPSRGQRRQVLLYVQALASPLLSRHILEVSRSGLRVLPPFFLPLFFHRSSLSSPVEFLTEIYNY